MHEEKAKRGDWSVRVKTFSQMSCDAENFYLLNKLDVFEGDELVFEREWEKTIKRNLT